MVATMMMLFPETVDESLGLVPHPILLENTLNCSKSFGRKCYKYPSEQMVRGYA